MHSRLERATGTIEQNSPRYSENKRSRVNMHYKKFLECPMGMSFPLLFVSFLRIFLPACTENRAEQKQTVNH